MGAFLLILELYHTDDYIHSVSESTRSGNGEFKPIRWELHFGNSSYPHSHPSLWLAILRLER